MEHKLEKQIYIKKILTIFMILHRYINYIKYQNKKRKEYHFFLSMKIWKYFFSFYENIEIFFYYLINFRSNVSYESIFRWRIYDIWLGCDTIHGGRSGRSYGSNDLHLSKDDQMYILQIWLKWRGRINNYIYMYEIMMNLLLIFFDCCLILGGKT